MFLKVEGVRLCRAASRRSSPVDCNNAVSSPVFLYQLSDADCLRHLRSDHRERSCPQTKRYDPGEISTIDYVFHLCSPISAEPVWRWVSCRQPGPQERIEWRQV